MSLRCISVWEIDHTADKHADRMFGIPAPVWLGIAPSGRDKMPDRKRKCFITPDIKHVCTNDLTKPIKYVYVFYKTMDFFSSAKERQEGQGCGEENIRVETLVLVQLKKRVEFH